MAALSNKDVNLFSDLLLHEMGPGLADDIVQGVSDPDEFRTAPLWGLGQRIFFLHDGRTTDLMEAIQAHKSDGNKHDSAHRRPTGVIDKFNDLSEEREAGPAQLPALTVALAVADVYRAGAPLCSAPACRSIGGIAR